MLNIVKSGDPKISIDTNDDLNNNGNTFSKRVKNKRWPNFFIVGAPRAGTTSLFHYLRKARGVYLPRKKEPLYFASRSLPDRLFGIDVAVVRDKHEYLKLYENVRDEVAIGDASASYLWVNNTPKLMHDAIPKARIIIMLRDPVERAFSHYLMHLSDGSETKLSFYDALKCDYENELSGGATSSHLYIGYGLYSKQVKRYLDIFGRQQIKILIFEEFVQNTRVAVLGVLEFLGIKGVTELPDNIEEAYNTYSAPRFRHVPHLINFMASLRNQIASKQESVKFQNLQSGPTRKRVILRKILTKGSSKPSMPEEARIFLEDLYRDDVFTLQQMLGRSLPWPVVAQYCNNNNDKRENGDIP
jgi:hypothetical protein